MVRVLVVEPLPTREGPVNKGIHLAALPKRGNRSLEFPRACYRCQAQLGCGRVLQQRLYFDGPGHQL